MAITIGEDLYHKQTKAVAEPFDEVEAERVTRLRAFIREAEDAAEREWRASPKPLSELKRYSFALDESLTPRKLRLVSGEVKWDYFGRIGFGGCGTVSARFRDVIERIEPGVHQFIPFDLYDKNDQRIDVALYAWRIRTALDAIDPSLGGVKPLEIAGVTPPGGGPDHLWTIRTGGGREKLAVRKELIAGRAAWRDVRFPTRKFVSDAVVSLLEEQGLTGWSAQDDWKEI